MQIWWLKIIVHEVITFIIPGLKKSWRYLIGLICTKIALIHSYYKQIFLWLWIELSHRPNTEGRHHPLKYYVEASLLPNTRKGEQHFQKPVLMKFSFTGQYFSLQIYNTLLSFTLQSRVGPASISKRFSEEQWETATVNWTKNQGYPVLQERQFLQETQSLSGEVTAPLNSILHLQKGLIAMYKIYTTAVLWIRILK